MSCVFLRLLTIVCFALLTSPSFSCRLPGLACNGIETCKDNTSIAIPAGVCYKGVTSSYILKCAANHTMYHHSYSSSDCSGTEHIVPASTIFSTPTYDQVNLVCNQSPCRYVEVTAFNNLSFASSTDCNQFLSAPQQPQHAPPDIHTVSLYVENYCNAYESPRVHFKWICADTQFPAVIANQQDHWQNDCELHEGNVDRWTAGFEYNEPQCVWGSWDIHTESKPDVYRAFLVNVTCDTAKPYYSADTPSPTNMELNTLQCNGIEMQKDGLRLAIPAGVCAKDEGSSSWMLTCYNDTALYRHVYPSSANCSGTDFIATRAAKDVHPLSEYDGVNIVCNMSACTYIEVWHWNENANATVNPETNWTHCRQIIDEHPEYFGRANMHTVLVNVENYQYLIPAGTWKWHKDDDDYIWHEISMPHSGVTSASYWFRPNQLKCASDPFVDASAEIAGGPHVVYIGYGVANNSHYVAPATTTDVPTTTTTIETVASEAWTTQSVLVESTEAEAITRESTEDTSAESTSVKSANSVAISNTATIAIVLCSVAFVVAVTVITVLIVRNRRVKQSLEDYQTAITVLSEET